MDSLCIVVVCSVPCYLLLYLCCHVSYLYLLLLSFSLYTWLCCCSTCVNTTYTIINFDNKLFWLIIEWDMNHYHTINCQIKIIVIDKQCVHKLNTSGSVVWATSLKQHLHKTCEHTTQSVIYGWLTCENKRTNATTKWRLSVWGETDRLQSALIMVRGSEFVI